MWSFKSSLEDTRRKDQLLRDHFLESVKGSAFRKLESDIAKQSIRDYESSLTLIRYLQSENEHLKRRNTVLEREAEDARASLLNIQEQNALLVLKLEQLREKVIRVKQRGY